MTSLTSEADTLPLIELGAPILGEPEKRALAEVIDSGWLAMGPRVRRFEEDFARVQQVEDAVAVNSATAGLSLMLAAFDVGAGDEVLVPSMTFVATAATVVHAGATPVFVDLEGPDRPHMSLDDARAKITPSTRAIVVMHYGGYLMDLPAWRALADEHGVLLLEDAAHVAGMAGEIGGLSDAAAFSFFANKNMTTAEGGMVIARDPDRLARIRLLRAHGMTASTLDRDRGRAVGYDVVEFGHNFRMDELRAAVGIVQLERLPGWNATRRELTATYRATLADALPTVTVPFDAGHTSTAHILPVLLPAGSDRTAVMAALRAARVQSSMHYPPVHRFSRYVDAFGATELPHTDAFADRELTLPLHPRLSPADVERVVASLREAL
ncbi:DegT/DnrJ/EryC1/StrS family aminotransferase [Pseudonocardia abyssalis]|uniref:DegT/DnrJ/EryC1/StrS family aminotransferase n=2 Tax=Pseudonocardia abyssalis TaxID=2792008 RepID=UPI001C49EF32|nr:DegT/DnrJ/EryC1/StrS aminotransferase family protein [Pseudonocardia abyssalis]